MCGICGFYGKMNIDLDTLSAMNNTMYHRGPNDSGAEIYQADNGISVGLAQRRLSIIDLSFLGHQPMHSADKRISLVFNGEIYNYNELKSELSDYPYRSTCDTEVIIAAYLKWGKSAFSRLHGMFAIALWDRDSDTLYLVRDRIGKKPLYYWVNGENIAFASELKPLMMCPGFDKKINNSIICRYLYQHYICEPYTVFENVYKALPGEIITICSDGVSKEKYWDIKEVYHQKKGTGPKDYEQAKQSLKGLLSESVRKRMIADVSLGTFLSGGYDSSLVTAIAQSLSDKPVKTFSIGFEDKKYDEAVYAKKVAEYLGTEHTQMYIDDLDMLRLVDDMPKYFDEPFADSSQIATMLVSELAKKHVTVALSGDGGDEFFCGYGIYDRLAAAKRLDGLGAVAHYFGKLGNIEQKYPFKVRVISGNRDKNAKTQFISGNYLNIAQSMVKGDDNICPYYDWEQEYREKNWQERRMLLDMETYLPGDILCKVDRSSMKYSLETRCPILDTDVMEFAFSIPHSFKYKNGIKKRILKDITHDYLPRELMERPKSGFAVPIDKWLRGSLRESLTDYAEAGYLERQGIFDSGYISEFLKKYLDRGDAGSGSGENYSRIVWAFYAFQQWYDAYMKIV